MTNKGTNVLLVYPNPMMDNLIPIGLSLLSACLKNAGHNVRLFDTTFYNTAGKTGDSYREKSLEYAPTDLSRFGISKPEGKVQDGLIRIIEEFKPNLVGVSVTEPTYSSGIDLLRSMHGRGIPTIVGGAFAILAAGRILQEDCVDMVCVGEGEDAVVELADKMSKGEDYTDVRNLWIKKNSHIIKNHLRPLKNLNELPLQDFGIYDERRFFKPYFGDTVRTAALETARGCLWNCTFCANPALREKYHGQKYLRFKSPEKVAAEVQHLRKKYRIAFLNIVDTDLFARSPEEFEKLARAYSKFAIPFFAEGRVDTVTESKARMLEEMRCRAFAFGVESGNEQVRREILNKKFSNEQVLKAFNFFKDSKIIVTVNNMIGIPCETREQIFDTIELNRALMAVNPNFRSSVAIYNPYEGTELKRVCIEKGYLSGGSFARDYRGEIALDMPQISRQELEGLHKTFQLYVRLPKDRWPQIRIAEQDDKAFEGFRTEYTSRFLKKK